MEYVRKNGSGYTFDAVLASTNYAIVTSHSMYVKLPDRSEMNCTTALSSATSAIRWSSTTSTYCNSTTFNAGGTYVLQPYIVSTWYTGRLECLELRVYDDYESS